MSYLDVFDSSQVHELIKRSFQSRHGSCLLVEYYNEINLIFMSLITEDPMV